MIPYVSLHGPRPVLSTKQDTELDKAQQEQVSLQDLQATPGGRGSGWGVGGDMACRGVATLWGHVRS